MTKGVQEDATPIRGRFGSTGGTVEEFGGGAGSDSLRTLTVRRCSRRSTCRMRQALRRTPCPYEAGAQEDAMPV